MEGCVQLHAPAALPSIKNLRCPVKGGPGRFREERNRVHLSDVESNVVLPVT
jgi:hypothetical protein